MTHAFILMHIRWEKDLRDFSVYLLTTSYVSILKSKVFLFVCLFFTEYMDRKREGEKGRVGEIECLGSCIFYILLAVSCL